MFGQVCTARSAVMCLDDCRERESVSDTHYWKHSVWYRCVGCLSRLQYDAITSCDFKKTSEFRPWMV